jgi:hypothetical protein
LALTLLVGLDGALTGLTGGFLLLVSGFATVEVVFFIGAGALTDSCFLGLRDCPSNS